MKVGVSFTIYKDFDQYIVMKDRETPDYTKALQVLNKIIKEMTDRKKLVIQYGKKPIDIILPIKMADCGNIFSKEDYLGECWEGVDIWYNIPNVEVEDFNSGKLSVKRCPSYFDVETIYY